PEGQVHEYCPPEHVASEVEQLLNLHAQQTEDGVPPELEAAWLHHRFTQIHPFQDGNGRVARCLATLVMLRAGWFPLVIKREHADEYLDNLFAADQGNLAPLVSLFTRIQRAAFVNAVGIARQLSKSTGIADAIRHAREDLQQRDADRQKAWLAARDLAGKLLERARSRFEEIRDELARQLGGLDHGLRFDVDWEAPDGERSHYFRYQVVETARSLGYYANLSTYHGWVRLRFTNQSRSYVLLSVHDTGREFRGVAGVSVCFFRRESSEEGATDIVDRIPLSPELFQVNYLDSEAEAVRRFDRWLERGLTAGIEAWRASL
ncbi:MAG: Fic family protein, partial [Candidatus Eremiobacterota bacterium]